MKCIIMVQTLPLLTPERQNELQELFGEFDLKELNGLKYLISR